MRMPRLPADVRPPSHFTPSLSRPQPLSALVEEAKVANAALAAAVAVPLALRQMRRVVR